MKRLPALLAVCLILATTALRLPAGIADNVVRARVAGIDVVAYKTLVRDVVTFCGSLPAGDALAPADNLAIPTLVGAMLDKGTTTRDKFAIAARLEAVGATLTFSVDDTMVSFSGKCLAKDLPLVITLLAEQLRQPAFDATEFAKLKKQLAGNIQRALEQPNYRASQAFSASIYPPGHPNHKPTPEAFLAAVNAATLDQLRTFHTRYYGPADLTLVAVGDIDPARIHAEVATAFAGWRGGVPRPAYARITAPVDATREQAIFMADKPNVSVILGQATTLRHSDPDALPLRVATAILGSGFTGRLMATVRDREGLTYGIGARVVNDSFTNGDWRIMANFAPDLLEKGLASTRRELTGWYEAGVTAEEVARTKTDLIGRFQVGLTTTDGIASTLLTTLNRGYPLSWIDDYPAKLTALTADQVNTAIKKHLRPESLVLIKAGTLPTPTH